MQEIAKKQRLPTQGEGKPYKFDLRKHSQGSEAHSMDNSATLAESQEKSPHLRRAQEKGSTNKAGAGFSRLRNERAPATASPIATRSQQVPPTTANSSGQAQPLHVDEHTSKHFEQIQRYPVTQRQQSNSPPASRPFQLTSSSRGSQSPKFKFNNPLYNAQQLTNSYLNQQAQTAAQGPSSTRRTVATAEGKNTNWSFESIKSSI